MKQSKFIAKTHIPASLVRAVSRQVGGWKELCRIAEDVANDEDGAARGVRGFMYQADTIPFFHRDRAAIVDFLNDRAAGLGYESALHLVWHLRGLDATYGEIAFALYAGKLKQLFQESACVPNAVAWHLLEKVCEEVTEFSSWEK